MKRLIFVNRFFYPDYSATSQILSDLAFHLAEHSHEVHVVTSRQRYDDPKADLPFEEASRGVRIHRVASTSFGRSALPGRALDYASFYASVYRTLLTLVRPDDIVVAKTDPPLISVVASHAAKRRGARLVNWVQDLYPEVALALGVRTLGTIASLLTALRDRSLKSAAANVVVAGRMAERIAARGVDRTRLHVIANWCSDEEIVPVEHADNPLRRQWGLKDEFVVGYSGNLGRAHEFETMLGAAERLRDHPRIVFMFVGGGYAIAALQEQLEQWLLASRFRFLPYQERENLKFSLSVPDVHWVTLRPELEGCLMPSKFYGMAAVGRPILAIGAQDGEIAELVTQHQCGIAVQQGDAAVLAAAIASLAEDPARCAAMGRRARAMLEDRFTRRQAFERWRAVLERIA